MKLYILIIDEQGKNQRMKIFFRREDGINYVAQHSEWYLYVTYTTYTIDVDELAKFKQSRGL